jgi:hypothetical protein
MIESLRERNNAAARKYRKNHPDRRRFIQAPRYGTTKAKVEACSVEQDNKCAICLEVFDRTPQIDHDHSTNKFRGLLCKPCNWLLGNARETVLILENAIKYLKRHGVSNEEA